MSACTSTGGGGVCTALFAYVTAIAVDTSGSPVAGLSITDTVVRTGHGFAVAQITALPSGTVEVFSDSYLGEVRNTGDAVHVTGTAGAQGFSASYTIGSDGCHVQKISGPDTVVVR